MDVIVNKKTFKTEVFKSKSKILIYFDHRVELTVTICCAIFYQNIVFKLAYADLLILKTQEKQKGLVRIQKGRQIISEAAKIVIKRKFKNGQKTLPKKLFLTF